ncbi:MAG: hypothetical protein V3U35_03605, partial [Candidatus Neomarinimicrobiota bacterium]
MSAMLLAAGFAGSLYAGQGRNPPSTIISPDSADEVSRGRYHPAPQLRPSTYQLVFSDVLPGESRTLFMNLANLGEGEIVLEALRYDE